MMSIAVIGGGPKGLCLATGLAQQGHAVALFDKHPRERLAEPEYDGREIALTHGTQALLRQWGIARFLPPDQLHPIRHAAVMDGNAPFALRFEPPSAVLGAIASNQALRQAAWNAALLHPNLTIHAGVEVRGVETDFNRARLSLSDGEERNFDLIVAADSRFSPTRRMMGIATDLHELGRSCLVCTMRIDGQHHDRATEMFLYGQTLAVLPLGAGRVSVVLTVDKARAAEFLALLPDALIAEVTRLTQGRYGRMRLDSDVFSYPLVTSFAACFHATRYALVGDAAVGMHPVTAHGFNLGLRGAATLVRRLTPMPTDAVALGACLARYSEIHRRTCLPLYLATNHLVALYTHERLAGRVARAALLRTAERFAPAKRLMMRKLTDPYAA